MSTDLSLDELQDVLRDRAQSVPAPAGLAQRATENARRIRRKRRVASASALVVVLAALSPLLIRELASDRQEPVRPVPTINSSLRWSETVPGLDLPRGGELAVPYAVGGTVTVGSREVDFEGTEVTQILDSAMGAIVVVRTSQEESGIWLLDGSEQLLVADHLWLDGSVVQGLGYDGQTHIAYAVDGPDTREIFAGPVVDPKPLGSDDRYMAAGFLVGEPVFASVIQPQVLTQFQTSEAQPRTPVEPTVVGRGVANYGAAATIAGWWEVDGGAHAFYQDNGCTDARVVPGFSWFTWTQCYELADYGALNVGPTYGAMLASVYELASHGHEVRTFDLPQSESDGTAYVLEPLGWETPTDVIIRVAAYDSAVDIRDRSPADGTYVAVRCSVDTGRCERLPHPVDVMANAVNKID